MNTAERLRLARKRKGLTQKQVADRCGIADSAVRKYESGKVRPKMDRLCKLAEALDVSVTELLDLPPEDKEQGFNSSYGSVNVDRLQKMYIRACEDVDKARLNNDPAETVTAFEDIRDALKDILDSCIIPVPSEEIQQADSTSLQEGNRTTSKSKNNQNSLPLVLEGLYSSIKMGTPRTEVEVLENIITGIYQMIDNAVSVHQTEYSKSVPDSEALLNAYEQLNEKGKQLAVERLKELALIPAYAATGDTDQN